MIKKIKINNIILINSLLGRFNRAKVNIYKPSFILIIFLKIISLTTLKTSDWANNREIIMKQNFMQMQIYNNNNNNNNNMTSTNNQS